MGDSDEEFEGRGRRGRDKFRRERSDFNERGPRRDSWSGRRGGGDGGREGWEDRRGRKRDYRDRRDHFGQRGESPPGKRRMRDWEGGGGYFGDFMGPYGMPGPWGPPDMPMPMAGDRRAGPMGAGGMGGPGEHEPMSPTQPTAMLSFKQWLAEQTDDIAEDDAVERYSTYKVEFKRSQLGKFFETHKDEEWFRERYHPRVKAARELEVRRQLRQRLNAFVSLLQQGRLDSICLENEKADQIVKLMDGAMIMMEGGSENDLRSLDRAPSPPPEKKKKGKAEKSTTPSKASTKVSEEVMEPPSPSSVPLPSDPPPSKRKDDKSKDESAKGSDTQQKDQSSAEQQEYLAKMAKQTAAEKAAKKEKKKHRRRHRDAYSYDTDDDSESDSDSESDAEEPAPPGVDFGPPGVDPAPPGVDAPPGVEDPAPSTVEPKAAEPEAMETTPVDRVTAAGNDAPADAEQEKTEEKSGEKMEVENNNAGDTRAAEPMEVTKADVEEGEEGEASGDEGKELGKDDKSNLPDPQPLHQTKSLYIRNVPPSVSRAELCAIGRKSSGFLRAAMAEPNLDRRCIRRAWLTYAKTVNIKDVHWSVNNIKVKDSELNVSINRDAANRVKAVSGIALAKQAIYSDIQLAARLIRHLDEKRRVYHDDPDEVAPKGDEDTTDSTPTIAPLMIHKNPVLQEMPEREEGEEDDFSDSDNGGESDEDETSARNGSQVSFERDVQQLKVLDKLICYLRLVHSVDFYQGVDYPEEDDMPHRCSIMHIRGAIPHRASSRDVRDHKKTLEQKMSTFLKAKKELSESDINQLGRREYDTEIDKFVADNCREVGKDKYLCPLSGKKFRGPDFVRKHIFNKHADRIEAVRQDVDFYNAYLRDPQRPQTSAMAASTGQTPGSAGRGGSSMRGHAPGHPGMMPRPGMGPGPQGGFDPHSEGMFNPPGFMGGWGPRPHMMGYGSPPFMPFPRNFGPPPEMFGRGPPFPHHRGRGRHDRKMISYHDLDQPEDVDF